MGPPGGVVSQYPEFGVSYRSIQDALADMAQAEAATTSSKNIQGLFTRTYSPGPGHRVR
jgi:hypothetical protein